MTSSPSQSPSFLQTSQQVPAKKIQNVSSRRLRKKNKPAKWSFTSIKWSCASKIYPQNLPTRTRPQIAISQVSRRHSKPGPAEMVRWDPFHHSKNNLSNFQAFCRTHFLVQKVRKTWCIYSIFFNEKRQTYILLLHVLYSFPNLSHSFFNLFSTIPLYTYLLHPTACFKFSRRSPWNFVQHVVSPANDQSPTQCYPPWPMSQWPVHGWGKFQWLCYDRMWGEVICWFMKNNAEIVQLNMLCYSNSIIYALSWYDVTIHDLR